MDVTYLTNTPSREGHQYILSFIDCFTKYAWFWALKRRDARSIYDCMKPFLETEKFEIIQTDNGGENCNALLDNFLKEQGIKHVTCSPYHPQSEGQVESLNGQIKQYLTAEVQGNWLNWHEKLESATHAYNTAHHTTIKV